MLYFTPVRCGAVQGFSNGPMSYALWAKRKKVNCNIAGTLDLSSYERAKLSWRQNISSRLISGYQLHSLQFNISD